MRGDAERQANMLLAVTPDSFIPEEHPIRRIKPIVESAAADQRVGVVRVARRAAGEPLGASYALASSNAPSMS